MGEPKRIRRRLGLLIFPFLGSRLLAWLHASCRWTFVGREPVDDLLRTGRPFVCATWHFDLISVLYHFRHGRGVVMVSRSRDGEPIARMVRRWGYEAVRGSKFKGGLDAARDLVKLVKQGRPAGLVADGSQGPARRAQTGAVFIARAARAQLIPAIVVAKRKINLKNWDQSQFPLPFTPIVMFFGTPITIPPKSESEPLEKYRRQLEQALNDLCAQAEDHQW
ncbi:MAG: lysophospholipid acyltransferase family protein [Thermodesulfobacteriota bacterium]|nr:lysophospholipid acyltransferase family protein [Thermodesulfobacteriota bacterium]